MILKLKDGVDDRKHWCNCGSRRSRPVYWRGTRTEMKVLILEIIAGYRGCKEMFDCLVEGTKSLKYT